MKLSASLGLTTLVFCSAQVLAAEPSERDRAASVSPGEETSASTVEARCPTFSWGSHPGATAYELVVYEVPGDSESDDATEPALRHVVVGSASAWTPPLERCLERGGTYAWSVRAVTKRSGTGWSAPKFFEVAAGPSRDEFEAALDVVQQYLAEREEPREQNTAAETSAASYGGTLEPSAAVRSPDVGPPRREVASAVATSHAFATSGPVNLGGRVTFGGGVQFSDRVTMTESMSGADFVADTLAGTNVCTAGYHPCTAWEAMVLDTLSADALFPGIGWVAGSFPNTLVHMRSLASGQDSVVCPNVTTYLQKWPSTFLYGELTTPGGIHCALETDVKPVYCCRNKG